MTEPTEQPEPGESTVNGVDRAAVVDLLGALAYGELTAFIRLAEDAELAPTLPETSALARLAVKEFNH